MFTPNALLPHFVHWGGLLETMYTQFSDSEVPENIKTLAKKVTTIEDTKTIEEIRYCLHFTKNELDYLNSPLLDEIFETMFMGNPLNNAILHDKLQAFLFYAERVEKKEGQEESWISLAESGKGSLKILRYFLENRKVSNLEEKILKFLDIGHVVSRFDENGQNALLLYLEYIPEISASLMKKISEDEYDYSLHAMEILEAFLEKVKCNEAAEHFLTYVLEIEDIEKEDVIMVEKLLKKFPELSIQKFIERSIHFTTTKILLLFLQHEKCKDVNTLNSIIKMAVSNMEIELLEFLQKEYNISPFQEFIRYTDNGNLFITKKFIEKFCKNTDDIMQLLVIAFKHNNTEAIFILQNQLCMLSMHSPAGVAEIR